MKTAAFLDRDGTVIEDAHYLSDAARIVLLPGVAEAVRTLNDASVLAVIVTNQSGIAQGLLTEAQYAATREMLATLMREAGARLDAQYHCPHYPSVGGPCECRKPGTGNPGMQDLDEVNAIRCRGDAGPDSKDPGRPQRHHEDDQRRGGIPEP